MKQNYKKAIVTGASSGIGASIANELVNSGAKVYALARNKKDLMGIQSGLPAKVQKNFIVTVCDVADEKKVELVIGKIFKNEKKIDLVISNAGVGYSKAIVNHTWDEVDQVIATNLCGTINIIKSSLEYKGSHPLHIVATSSLAGKMGFPEMPIYSATKFAIEGLIESLRYEYPKDEVSLTVLRPGITATPFFAKAGMQGFKESVENLKSFYTPDRVAKLFLSQLKWGKKVIVIGNDKYFLPLLPFIPFSARLKVLDVINKL